VYIPAGKRRRRVAMVVAAGVVVGILLGLLIGRATAPGLSDGVSKARNAASTVVDALDSLPIEYERTLQGAAGKSDATFTASLDRVDHTLDDAIAKAEWFGPSAKQRLHAAVAKVRADAVARVSTSQFGDGVTAATRAVDDEFGIHGSGA